MNKELYVDKMLKDRLSKDGYLKNEPDSPILEGEREGFTNLNYFDPDIAYRFELELNEFAEKQQIIVKDSKGNDRHFFKYGKFEFKVGDSEHQLVAYKADMKDRILFIPFKDNTTAKETYGAGRYLDLSEETDKVENKWLLDLNLAYNPWCAYNSNYSCPLVPDENVLKVAIPVGEKKLM